MNVLVIGGTGTVGTQVVRALLVRGADVTVLTRSKDKASTIPPGASAAIGNLQDPAGITARFAGVDAVFCVTALSQSEALQGQTAVAAAKAAGVNHFIYVTVHRVTELAHIPHFGSKLPIVKALRESGMGYTLLEPNNFFQNDFRYRDAITGERSGVGFYPQPLGSKGVSRVDVRDIADAGVRAILDVGPTQQAYSIVGPEPLTGESVAAEYRQQLEHPVHYAGDDLEKWAEAARAALPEWLVHDLGLMYAHFQTHGLLATDEELRLQEQILGKPPRRFQDFVAEIAPGWKR